MRRVSVVGSSGAGKTTVGRRLAGLLEVPFVELDGIFHQPSWTELPLEEFRARVADVVANEAWVVDGNYSGVRDLVWARADTVVWLDLPRLVVVRRVVSRTLRRALLREALWNGNHEPFTNFYRWDPEHNIIRWAWLKHPGLRARYGSAALDPQHAGLRFVRLTNRRAIDCFLHEAGSSS